MPFIIVDDTLIQWGAFLKNNTPHEQSFPKPFGQEPTVVISPQGPDPVTAAETLVDITTSNFTVNSTNKGPDYFVQWIAIGSASDGAGNLSQEQSLSGSSSTQ